MAGRGKPWLFLSLVAVILGALPVGYFLWLGQSPTAVPPPAPAPAEAQPLRIAQVTGAVQVRRGAGAWANAVQGDKLSPSDAVRTPDGSVAVLVAGEEYEVRLSPGTFVSVESLTASISRLLLANGMATATVKEQGRHTFEVKAEGSDAVARTQKGTFAMSNNGAGTVAVGTQDGEVAFLGSGKAVIVRAGQQSIVRPGQGPSDPVAVPNSLLLKVQWPAASEINRRKLVLKGEVEPGSRVEVMGKVVPVDAHGAFTQTLQLVEGKNAIGVEAQSVGGLAHTQKHDILVDTTPPRVGVDPNLWKKR